MTPADERAREQHLLHTLERTKALLEIADKELQSVINLVGGPKDDLVEARIQLAGAMAKLSAFSFKPKKTLMVELGGEKLFFQFKG